MSTGLSARRRFSISTETGRHRQPSSAVGAGPPGSRAHLWHTYREALPDGREPDGSEADLLWSMIQGAPGAFLVLDMDRRVRLWSRRAETMFGWTEEEVLGRPPPIVPDGESDKFHALFEEIIAGNEVKGRELRRERKDGTMLDCAVWADRLVGPDGGVLGVRAICLDISERKAAERHRAIFHHNVAGVFVTTSEGELLDCNPAFARMFGFDSVDEALERAPEVLQPRGLVGGGEAHRRLEEEGELRNVELRREREDGREIQVLMNARLVQDPRRQEPVALGTMVDITERREAEQRFRGLFEHSRDLIFVIAEDGRVLDANPRAAEWSGWSRDELRGRKIIDLHPDAVRDDARAVRDRVLEEGELRFELPVLRADGSQRLGEFSAHRLEVGGRTIVHSIGRDVTERRELEDQLRHRALHDHLTGLANRALFQDRLQHALDRAARSDEELAILYLDLDGFKAVNDSLGHDAGDRVLREVARRLRNTVRAADTVARIGGDEFTILLEDAEERQGGREVAERLVEAFRDPFELSEARVPLSASIGVAVAALTGDPPEPAVLLDRADRAMFEAKERPGTHVSIFAGDAGGPAS